MSYDDLTRIERSYGCYAEYARQREEDEAYEYEQQAKQNEYCRQNKLKLDSAGDSAMDFCEDCMDCKYYEDVGPTIWSEWNWDDVTHGICHHKGTPFLDVEEPFCKGKEKGAYADEQN